MNMANEIGKNNALMNQDTFVGEIRTIINQARSAAVRSVDFSRVQMYWNIGRRIVEEEQHGKERADDGTYLIKNLAKELEPEYGSGFGVRQLERARQFYRVYPIASTVRSQLNWSQYRMLIQIEDTVVKMALPEDNSTILASKYQLYLPTTEQLIKEIDEENNSQPEIYAALL